jgi:BirA family biotin operon repressor/biotin-[acetyl-CoA-carboxylase] ligase
VRALAVGSPWSPAPVLYVRRTGSTMDDALRLWRNGSPGGTVVVAGHQARGRGRRQGRVWQGQAGRNLLFTIALDRLPAIPPQRLPVLAGLAVSLSLEEDFDLRTEVKWPNDLLCQGRKLAGVLCEALAEGQRRLYLVGIGVNCNQLRFGGDLRSTAISLARLLDRPVDLWAVLEGILRRLAACLDDPLWKDKLLARLHGLGYPAVILSPENPASRAQEGVLEGIADDGALLLRPAGGAPVVAVYGGELTLAPAVGQGPARRERRSDP